MQKTKQKPSKSDALKKLKDALHSSPELIELLSQFGEPDENEVESIEDLKKLRQKKSIKGVN